MYILGCRIGMILSKSDKWVIGIGAWILILILAIPLLVYFLTPSGCGCGTPTPAGVITTAENIGTHAEKLTFGEFNPDTPWSDCKLFFANVTGVDQDTLNYTYHLNYTFTMSHSAGIVVCKLERGKSDFSIAGADLQKDNKISRGDYIIASRLAEHGSYQIGMLYIPTGALICYKTFIR